MKLAIVSVTTQGDHIAGVIQSSMKCEVYTKDFVKSKGIKNIVGDIFNEYDGIIFISSTGIAVRSISEFLRGKTQDPAVVVVDASGKYAISLLSGHLGGANELADEISKLIKAQPIITTATDNMGVTAPDMIAKLNKLRIDSMDICKDIAALLVEGKKILFIDEERNIETPKGYVGIKDYKCIKEIEGIVVVSNKINPNLDFIKDLKEREIPILKLVRSNIILGIGCRKNYDSFKMMDNTMYVLNENNIDIRAVDEITTVDLKADEEAILYLANKLECNIKIHIRKEIQKVQHLFKGSDFVEKSIGVRSVCEPCVQLSGGTILLPKTKCNGMTICIGKY